MKCNEALVLMDLVLDKEASPEEEQLLRFHVNGCTSCKRAFLLSKSISEKVRDLEEPEPPSDLIDIIHRRLSAGDYDMSPLKEKERFKLPVWRIAAVIPFAAALVFFLNSFSGEETSNYGDINETAIAQEPATLYAPAPVIAYSRPSSVSTF